MEKFFLNVLNMSFAAYYVILAILLLRLLLNKAPKKYSYVLWSAAAFRLCCPVSFPSVFSLFGLLDLTQKRGALGFVPETLGTMAQPQVHTGVPVINAALEDSLPAATPAASVNPMQIWILAGTLLWCAGAAVMLLYGAAGYFRLRRRLRTATRLEGKVFQSENVRSPFILGVFRPRIYLPYGLDEENRRFVLVHERFHLKRRDPFVRLFAYCLLALHWFNPLVWLAFSCMSRDMEMSCDEKVLESGSARAYSLCLLSIASNRRFPSPAPLAFGETGVKGRIKNALAWKKPRRWAAVVAALLCAAAILGCAANPLQSEAFDGTYRAGELVAMSVVISYSPPDGEAVGIREISLSGSELTVTGDDWIYHGTVEAGTISYEELVESLDTDPTLRVWSRDGGWALYSDIVQEVVPQYDSAKDMVVCAAYDGTRAGTMVKTSKETVATEIVQRPEAPERIPDYTLYFFHGEPLWFSMGNGFIFRMERLGES